MILGTFVKLRKATTSFIMYVRPSACNVLALTGRIFMKFDIWIFFEKLSRKIQVLLKSDNNIGYFTWIPKHISNHISVISS
jgi:hypothetical protein